MASGMIGSRHRTTSGSLPQSDAAMGGERPFFSRVESLRGLGAMAIAAYHISGSWLHGVALFPEMPWKDCRGLQCAVRWFGNFCLPAHAALMIFFVISGFVLRVSLGYGPQKVSVAAPKFLLRRIFRLYPIVIFALVLTALLPTSRVFAHNEAVTGLTAPLLLKNLLLLDVSMNSTYWALQVELIVVPCIFFLYYLERSSGPRVLLWIALVTTGLSFVPHWAIWPPLSTNIFPFVLGMVIPTLGRRFVLGLSIRAASFWTMGALILLMIPGPSFGLFSRCSAVIEGYAAVFLVSLIAYRYDVTALKWLDARPLRLVGCSSGSFYVLHMVTAPVALGIAAAIVPPAWSVSAPILVGVLVVAGWLLALTPLTVCTYHLIEAPGIALGKCVIGLCGLDARPDSGSAEQPIARRLSA
jgi:peptidoglycan/LPS O-acetylase OafA/YrhL